MSKGTEKGRGKRSRILLKAYRLYLLGNELDPECFTESEIQKVKTFHDRLQAGHAYFSVRKYLKITEFIARGMWLMYTDFIAGQPIRDIYPITERPRISRVYELMLAGLTEKQLRNEGFSEYEISQANLFKQYEAYDMLPAMISQKTGILVSTIKRMQRCYKNFVDGKAEMEAPISLGVTA